MGDVAMTVPVIKMVLDQHPGLHITVVSNAFLQPLFAALPRCTFHPAFLKEKHQGLAGMYNLFRELNAVKFDAVVDLHGVLRSQLLTTLFSLSAKKTVTIDKGRSEKRRLTRRENKVLVPLTPMHERYAAVFRRAGLEVALLPGVPVYPPQKMPDTLSMILTTGKPLVGVAPFAQYPEKMYPLEKMESVVKQLSATATVLLFGGGVGEAARLQQWEEEMQTVVSMAGKFTLAEELAIISNLQCMVSMDSANMHLASLYNIPVISVWGATHPFAGFYGWAQPEENILQASLYCRPCSVFGNKPCYRGDHACMQLLSTSLLYQRILQVISSPAN